MSRSTVDGRTIGLVLATLTLVSCGVEATPTAEPSMSTTSGSFDKIVIGDGLSVIVTRGQAGRGRAEASGPGAVMTVTNKTLTIASTPSADATSAKAHVSVVTPVLSSVEASSGAVVSLDEGMTLSGQEGELRLASAASFSGEVDSRTLTLVTGTGARAEPTGTVFILRLTATQAGAVSGKQLTASRARVTMSGSAQAELMVRERLDVAANSGSQLTYYGDPTVTKKVSSSARVTRG